MTVFVTGGSGFIGSRVVRMLAARGDRVRALVRPTSPLQNLEGLPIDLVRGDLLDRESYEDALRGCDQVYHLAADYRLWSRSPKTLYRVNVDGTRLLLQAAGDAGVNRIVYTSSVGALGLPRGGGQGRENTPVALEDMVGHYKRSKFLAEEVALQAAEAGLPVVIVNPSTPVGPGDIKPTPTGQMILDFLNRRMPAYVDTGLNLVDVDDVAAGHLLAAEKGRVGQKYILGCRDLTLREILESLARLTGTTAPHVRIPWPVAFGIGAVNTLFVGGLLKRKPRVPLEGVRMARKKMFFNCSRAIEELGLPQSPVEQALGRATRWFCEHGYVREPHKLQPGLDDAATL